MTNKQTNKQTYSKTNTSLFVLTSEWRVIKLDIVTVKFELILWDKKGEKLHTEVGLVL